MNIIKTQHYIEINGSDGNGEFTIRIQKDGSQLQLDTADTDAYIDTNFRELKIIRDSINEVINDFDNSYLGK